MRSKTIEKILLCCFIMLSMSSAAYLYSMSLHTEDISALNSIIQDSDRIVKSLPDTKIIDFIINKAEDIINASYQANCIH